MGNLPRQAIRVHEVPDSIGTKVRTSLREHTVVVDLHSEDRVVGVEGERVGFADLEAVIQPVLHANLRDKFENKKVF